MTSTTQTDRVGHQVDVATSLINGLVNGDVAGVKDLFVGPADIDDPAAGRQIDGGFDRLVTSWAPANLARVKSVELAHHTAGKDGKFAGSEFHLVLEKDGGDKDLDVVVISEFDESGGLVRNRLYYRLARVTGVQHLRTRILPEEPVHLEPFNPVLDAYQKALRKGDPDGQADTFSEDGVFNGHGESQDLRDGVGMGIYRGREEVRAVLREMFDIGDEEAGHAGEEHAGAVIEKLNVIDDGTTTVLEFNIVHLNHPVNRTSAGVAAYELGSDGLIKEARVYDEAW
ncbi:SnoaL-like protein [Microcella alkaliphila]|uniref:SnoaL-like protein n=1 Tax=Microcella alkaliphila TaxID=279828 RepID=A0A4Q7U1T4_9MICO|nr:nuclear transport factor 2 family protein [Microcella alkaliphila]RZT66468.1 SnoaL-like protein [Microcella alkaliphila]